MLKVVSILVVLCGIGAVNSMGPQQSMYRFHYQNQQLRNQHRMTGMSTFAAGPFLRSARTSELPVQDDENVDSVAEAIPAEQSPVDDESQDDAPAVNDQETEEATADEPVVAAPAVAVAVPEKKKKKVTVQLDSDEDDEEEVTVNRHPGIFFPVNFGSSTNGGAIAVANSYSTGKGGSAISTASAYGSPTVDQLRRAAPFAGQLRKRPAKQY